MYALTRGVWWAAAVGLLGMLLAPPAAADEALLRRAFGAFMRGADELRIEAIPDLHDGGYARISVFGRRVMLIDGPRVDEATVRLVGVSLDPASLRAGTIKVLDVRDSAMRARVLLRSLQDYFNTLGALEGVRFSVEDGYLVGTGIIHMRGHPTRFRMKGFFAVTGTTEVFFYFDTLHANGLPMPTLLIREIERDINPVVHQRNWPVTFRIRSVRLDAQGLTVSSEGDGTCPACGGGEQPVLAP